MRLKLGVAIATIAATFASLAFTALPAAAANYPTSIATTGSATRTDIADAELGVLSIDTQQDYSIPNLRNGIYYFGAQSTGSQNITIRSYSNGELDLGFGGGTGVATVPGQLAPTSRARVEMATYYNGTKWLILEMNSVFGSGTNYLHLGTVANGYVETKTLPSINTISSSYCSTSVLPNTFTRVSSNLRLIQASAYTLPNLFITCNAYLTAVGGAPSAYDFIAYMNGASLSLGSYNDGTGAVVKPVTPLATPQNPTVKLGGYSSMPGAFGSEVIMTFFHYRSSATTAPWEPSAYGTDVWSDYVVTRRLASGDTNTTSNAWTPVTPIVTGFGTVTGTLMIPPTNNGTIYALSHVTDTTANSAMKLITFGSSGAGSSGSVVTGSTGLAGPMGRAEIVAAASPSAIQKVALKDGGSGGYWHVSGTTAVATAGGKFTSSDLGSIESLYWQPSEDSSGVSVYSRTSTSNLARLAFTLAPSVPSTPNAPTATRGNEQVSLSWTAPANGGAALTDYEIDYSSNSGSTWTTFADGTSATASATVTGLTNGTSYTFRIRAKNSAGTSASSSASTAVTPAAVATAPTNVVGSFGNAQVALSWTAPSSTNGSAITDYTIQYSTNAGSSWSTYADLTSSATSATIIGLFNGTSYTFKVAAVNGVGTSAYSAVSSAIVPATKAVTIGGVPVTQARDTAVSISWTAPANNGCAISDYAIEVTSDNGATYSTFVHTPSDATSQTVTGLTNGTTYRLRVAAVNCAGTSAFSLLSGAVVPNPVPSQTSGLTVSTTGQSNQLALSWSAPSGNGSAITDYLVEYSTDGGATWSTMTDGVSTATTVTFGYLNNGVSYSFRVSAISAIGTGTASSASASIVVVALPDAITSAPTAVASPGQIALTWSAPASNGGTPITDYLIQYSTDGGQTWQTYTDGVSASTTATLTGLTAGDSYTFKITAINSLGSGSSSSTSVAAIAQAATAPGVVGQPTATTGANPGEVVLTWTAPAANGSVITDYVVEYSLDGGVTWITFTDGTSTATTATITGLAVGTSYVFRVTAVNSVGSATAGSSSAAQAPAAAPATAPGVVAQPSATAGANPGEVVLTWTAPAANGSAITDYVVEYSLDGGVTWVTFADGTSAATTATITGLTSGTSYVFRVIAVNAVGSATAGSSSAAQLPAAPAATAPGAVAQPTATAGSNPGEVVLSWTAPAANGSAITDYVVEYSLDGGVTWVNFPDGTSTATTATITGLTSGTSYVFRVSAVNGVGSAAAGTSSVAQLPAASVPVVNPPAEPVVNPRYVPGEVTFGASRSVPAGGKLTIQGNNLDMIIAVLVGNRTAPITLQTQTLLEFQAPTRVIGYADLTLVYALGNIHFPNAVQIAEPGPATIALATFWKHKISQRSAAVLIKTWPSTVGATEVVCVARYSKNKERALAMWRAKRTCASLQAARKDINYSVAVARIAKMTQVELRIKY